MDFVIQIRFKLTATSMRARASAQDDTGARAARQEMWEQITKKLGMELIGLQWSITYGLGILTLRGEMKKAVTLVQMMTRSGGYDSIEQEVIVDLNSISNNMSNVRELEKIFASPDQDEIDRMLLED